MSYEHKVLGEQYLCTHWPKHVITPLVRRSINSTTYNFTEAKVPIRINIPDAQYLNTHIHTLMQFNAWNLPHVFTLCVCFLCPCDKMWFGRHSSGFENFARCSYCNVRLRTDFVRSTESQLYEVQSWHFTGEEWVRRWAWCNAIAMDYALLIHLQGCKRHKPGTSRGRGKVKYTFLRICLITSIYLNLQWATWRDIISQKIQLSAFFFFTRHTSQLNSRLLFLFYHCFICCIWLICWLLQLQARKHQLPAANWC